MASSGTRRSPAGRPPDTIFLAKALGLARKMGAGAVINAKTTDPVAEVGKLCDGAQGVLVAGVSPAAFKQGLGMLGKRGTMYLVGLPPGSFELDIFDAAPTLTSCDKINGQVVMKV